MIRGGLATMMASRGVDVANQAGAVLVHAFHRKWQERCKNEPDEAQRLRLAPLAPLGKRTGQLTMRSSRSSSGTSSSPAPTLPRTDTPAACTVSGSPETSGCHQ